MALTVVRIRLAVALTLFYHTRQSACAGAASEPFLEVTMSVNRKQAIGSRVLCALLPSVLAATAIAAQTLEFDARSRRPLSNRPEAFEIVSSRQAWDASQTAVIICDMWDRHWCKGAMLRTGELVPAMNDFVIRARDAGALVIHAPSDTMGYYADHPARRTAEQAPRAANLPKDIASWCSWLDEHEKEVYPIDQSDGGCDCLTKCPGGSPWRKQIDGLNIHPEDAISDSGVEIWNLMEARGIKNVMIMGVHTNMCVLGRPFGLRNMARNGKNVVLVRDLTDTMYNSRMRPFVSHFTGTDLIIEHIEKYVCPTMVSTALTGRPRFRFKEDNRPTVAFLIAEREYGSNWTIPQFAAQLQRKHNVLCEFLIGVRDGTPEERNTLSNMDVLATADLAVVYVRRRALPEVQMKYLRDYLDNGKGLIGIRTASHAFDAKGNKAADCIEWPGFDPEVLGGNYNGHYGKSKDATKVTIVPAAKDHPILKGVCDFESPSWLYRVRPLAPTTRVLMMGEIKGKEPEPVLWTNTYKGGRIVYTSLGHWDDFKIDSFERLLTNAIFWAMNKEVP
jgi:type 1 glutamine amidotransferase/nicotinamidase-related amidase